MSPTDSNVNQLLVLNYHGIEGRPFEYSWDRLERVYVLGQDVFEAQMDWLKTSHIPVIDQSGLEAFLAGRLKSEVMPVMLTFDDGHISHLNRVAPSLAKRNLKGLFFVSVDLVGYTSYMDWSDIRALARQGFEIGSHGYHHMPLAGMSLEVIGHEMMRSREVLEDKLGVEIRSFSIPRGFFRPVMERVAAEVGYRYMFTSEFGLNKPDENPFCLKRVAITRRAGVDEFRGISTGKFGHRRVFSEKVKSVARTILPPEFYDFLSAIKHRKAQKEEDSE